ncbi:carboxylating nicotinate-nucleotide diphosphorylase [Curvivirga aplysinae]|uniref:carboxylating nicotinate-nucleotide diphosphorylase n=1 Tax=Curvivirga aplysinae TaxID=2529852 RepID=UPI0012BB6F04|nr:carboxylating nicotinate-nucleotide diphosphorylase [Curvivirga aplysinae]MTI10806.1 carboxylating nicotinate-nucleotide diphosphorylase [Curvivirga aplysinae]
MTDLIPLPQHIINDAVKASIAEDFGRAGDITSDSIIPADMRTKVALRARIDGCIAGTDFAKAAFTFLDRDAKITVHLPDGSEVKAGDTILTIEGNARAVLGAERVALNFMGRMSGIASVTREIVNSVKDTKARITCTRKTTPGLRAIEKYAVRAGGGFNHRFGLDDAILIKDNHIAVIGGVKQAIHRAKSHTGHMVKIEVEVDTLEQLNEALEAGADVILLDNMTPEMLTKAVKMIDGKAVAEASGGVTAKTAPSIAATGVDVISIGWLTHSAPNMDLGLDTL